MMNTLFTMVVALELVMVALFALYLLNEVCGARVYEVVERMNKKYNNRFTNKVERVAFRVVYLF